MFRLLLMLPIIAITIALTPVLAVAAPVSQPCDATAFRQYDMAGVYVSSTMTLEMFPCGGSALLWRNAYGEHTAIYSSYKRLDGGGVIAEGLRPDPVFNRYMDDAITVGFKPAEPGYIQIITARNGEIVGAYTLRKIK